MLEPATPGELGQGEPARSTAANRGPDLQIRQEVMLIENVRFHPLTRPQAEQVMSWRYPAPYELYNHPTEEVPEIIATMLRPDHRYYAALRDGGEMVAFRCFGAEARVAGETIPRKRSIWAAGCVPISRAAVTEV